MARHPGARPPHRRPTAAGRTAVGRGRSGPGRAAPHPAAPGGGRARCRALLTGARKPPWLRVPARMGDEYLGLRRDGARPRPGHGVRGGRLPEHLRVLGGRHGHLHDQRRALHAGVRVLPGRHPPPAGRPTPTSPTGWPRPSNGSASPTRWSPLWRATTSPTAARPGSPRRSAPSGTGARRRRWRCSSPTARATRRSLATIFEAPPRRAQPQPRDRGAPAARRSALGRLRRAAWPSWPGPRTPGWSPSRG